MTNAHVDRHRQRTTVWTVESCPLNKLADDGPSTTTLCASTYTLLTTTQSSG